MERKVFLRSILIFSLFFFSILSLIFSGLTVTKAIIFQNEIIAIFIHNLQTDILTSLTAVISYVLQNIVIPLLPFLILTIFGILSVLYFFPSNKELLIIFFAVLILSLLIKFSIVILLVCLSFFILIPIGIEEKTPFKTAKKLISSLMKFINIFIAVGLFFGILSLSNFEEIAQQQMLNNIRVMLPDIEELQQVQTEIARSFIEQASTDVETIVDNEYIKLSTGIQTQCSEFKENIKSEIENYKLDIISKLESGEELGVEETAKEVFSKIGIFSMISKSIPLTSAFALFFLLELLRQILSLLGGLLYSILVRWR